MESVKTDGDKTEQQGNSMTTLIAKYGTIGLITHLSISWTILLGFYLGVRKASLGPKLIQYLKLRGKIPQKASDIVIALAAYKVIMPFRIGLSILAIPTVASYLHQDKNQNTTTKSD